MWNRAIRAGVGTHIETATRTKALTLLNFESP